MENSAGGEFSQPKPPEISPESSLDLLLEKTGFRESPEMSPVGLELIEALKTNDVEKIPSLANQYRVLGEPIADEQETARGRLGLDISFARLLLKAGRTEDYLQYLDEALGSARQEGFDDIVVELEKLIKLAKPE